MACVEKKPGDYRLRPGVRSGRGPRQFAAGIVVVAAVATLLGCQTASVRPGTAAPVQPVLGGTDPCDQTHKDFITAAAAYSQPVSQSSPQGIGDLTSQADLARLRADAQAADDALAGLVGTFGTLAACRSDVLTPAELRAAHTALDIADAKAKALTARLAREQGGRPPAAPGRGASAAAALAAEQPYLATDGGEIFDRPDSRARKIATLRKGQRLTSPAQATAVRKPGWLAIDLNDGSIGYVPQDLLRPLASRATGTGAGNASAAVVTIDLITQALPEKLAALQARLAASEATVNGGG